MKKQFYTLLCMAGLIASVSSCKDEGTKNPEPNTPGYYFAVTSLDEWGNESSLSNVVFNENASAPTVSKAISDINPAVKAHYVANKSARQSVDNAVPNILYVKFKKPVGVQALSLSDDKKSVGVANVDAVTSKISGARLEKCFPSGPKTEARHREAGLDLWYYVVFDNQDKATLSRTVQMFDVLDEIEYVETMKVGEVRRIDDTPVVKATPSMIASDASRGAALPFNDPMLKDQWHYDNIGVEGVDERANVNLFKAWEKNTGDRDVIVAIIDQGVDYNHVDLNAVMWVNEDEALDGKDTDGNGYIDDIHGFNFSPKMNADGSWPAPPYIYTGPIEPGDHGTHVAGTVGAINNNGVGVCGVAGGGADGKGGVRMMSVQIFGPGGAADDSGNLIHQAVVYAADNGAVIAQNSWGQANFGTAPAIIEEAFTYFIKNAGNKDMFPNSPMEGGVALATTGNADNDIAVVPVMFKDVIGVTSISHERKKADSASYGVTADITAPGGNSRKSEGNVLGVLSTIRNNEYGYNSGTSMACPHVSGIAALYISQNKGNVTPAMVRERLLTSCVSIADTEPNFYKFMGKGLIDANKVLRTDGKVGPEAITDLEIRPNGGGFELAWTVPADEDSFSAGYKVYFSKTPITENTISQLKFDEKAYSQKEMDAAKASYVIK